MTARALAEKIHERLCRGLMPMEPDTCIEWIEIRLSEALAEATNGWLSNQELIQEKLKEARAAAYEEGRREGLRTAFRPEDRAILKKEFYEECAKIAENKQGEEDTQFYPWSPQRIAKAIRLRASELK